MSRLAPDARFSVVIPTLQRSEELPELLALLDAHPRVGEILLINNAQVPIEASHRKLRVLQQEQNIYVNPAWNLGAREAAEQLLAIVNDDILFDPEVLDIAAERLVRRGGRMIGVDGSEFNRAHQNVRVRIATYGHITRGFGAFMCVRREDYVPIPEEILIWGGDDWLFLSQRMPSWVLFGGNFRTEMSATTSSPEFVELRKAELERTNRAVGPLWGTRWWHGPVDQLARARSMRARLRTRLAERRRVSGGE